MFELQEIDVCTLYRRSGNAVAILLLPQLWGQNGFSAMIKIWRQKMKIYFKKSVTDGKNTYDWTDEKGLAARVFGVAKTKDEIMGRAKKRYQTDKIELVHIFGT
jgi:hypothetical protein